MSKKINLLHSNYNQSHYKNIFIRDFPFLRMALWLIIVGLLILGLILLLVEHHTRNVKVVAIILVVLLIYASISSIGKPRVMDTGSLRGIIKGVYVYFIWIGDVVSGAWDEGVIATGKVIDVFKKDEKDKDKS